MCCISFLSLTAELSSLAKCPSKKIVSDPLDDVVNHLVLLSFHYIHMCVGILSTSAGVNTSLTLALMEATGDKFPPSGQMTHPQAWWTDPSETG